MTNAQGTTTVDNNFGKARIIWLVVLLLCTVSVVLQIIGLSTKELLYGERVDQYRKVEPVAFGRVRSTYGMWEICEEAKTKYDGFKDSCYDVDDFKDCNDIKERLLLVQAASIIAVIFTGVAWILELLGVIGIDTVAPRGTLRANIVVFFAMAFTLVAWSVVCHLKFEPDYCSNRKVINVSSIDYGYSFVVILVAWILLVIQLILQFVIGYVAQQAVAAKDGAADVEAHAAGPTEPVATEQPATTTA